MRVELKLNPVKLKPEVKAKWVTALRGGEYKQGKNQLRIVHGIEGPDDTTRKPAQYCCLGVLCDLAAKEDLGSWDNDTFNAVNDEGRVGGHQTVLPWGVAEWAFVNPNKLADRWQDPEASSADGKTNKTLSMWNDFGANFAQIADLIEENL